MPYTHYPVLLLTTLREASLVGVPQHAASKEHLGGSLRQRKFGKSRASFRNSHITTRPAEQLPGSGALHHLQSEPNRFCHGVVRSARTDHASGIWDSLLHALVDALASVLDGCSFHVETRWWAPCIGHRWLEHHRLAQGH